MLKAVAGTPCRAGGDACGHGVLRLRLFLRFAHERSSLRMTKFYRMIRVDRNA